MGALAGATPGGVQVMFTLNTNSTVAVVMDSKPSSPEYWSPCPAASTHAQVTGLFGGLPLLPSGVVPVSEWRRPAGEAAQPCDLYGGVARVPRRGAAVTAAPASAPASAPAA